MITSLIKKSFYDVIKNPVVTLFLVLYSITVSIIISAMAIQNNAIIYYVLACCAFLFNATFIAGWFRIIKELVLRKEQVEEKIIIKENTKTLPAVFLEGAGENVIPCLIGLLINVIAIYMFAYLAYLISMRYFGNPVQIITELQNSDSLMDIANFSQDKMVILYGCYLCFTMAMSAYLFTFIYYFPAIAFDNTKNIFKKPFIALKNNFCFLFKHFFKTLAIYLALSFIYIVVACLRAFLTRYMSNEAEYIIVNVLYIFYIVYFLSFSVMLICNYYGTNHSCDNGPDCIGEDKDSDKTGKEE